MFVVHNAVSNFQVGWRITVKLAVLLIIEQTARFASYGLAGFGSVPTWSMRQQESWGDHGS